MSKNVTQRVGIDVAMFLTMLVSLVSGVVLWLFIPNGRGSGYTVFLEIEKHLWTDIHIYVSLIFCGILLLHLALNLKLFSSMANCIVNRGRKTP
jgi:uncharacterized iron-regulated membrane protein